MTRNEEKERNELWFNSIWKLHKCSIIELIPIIWRTNKKTPTHIQHTESINFNLKATTIQPANTMKQYAIVNVVLLILSLSYVSTASTLLDKIREDSDLSQVSHTIWQLHFDPNQNGIFIILILYVRVLCSSDIRSSPKCY